MIKINKKIKAVLCSLVAVASVLIFTLTMFSCSTDSDPLPVFSSFEVAGTNWIKAKGRPLTSDAVPGYVKNAVKIEFEANKGNLLVTFYEDAERFYQAGVFVPSSDVDGVLTVEGVNINVHFSGTNMRLKVTDKDYCDYTVL